MRRSTTFYILWLSGILLIGVGLYIGMTSHQIVYEHVAEKHIAHYLADDQINKGYLQMEGSPNLYIVYPHDFIPAIDGTQTFKDGYIISFIYSLSDTEHIDATSVAGVHLMGLAYKVVHITLVTDTGKIDFDIASYIQHPQSYYHNTWPFAAIGLLAGLLLVGGSFFLSGRTTLSPSTDSRKTFSQAPAVQERTMLEPQPVYQQIQMSPPVTHGYTAPPLQTVAARQFIPRPATTSPQSGQSSSLPTVVPPRSNGQFMPRPFSSPQPAHQQPDNQP